MCTLARLFLPIPGSSSRRRVGSSVTSITKIGAFEQASPNLDAPTARAKIVAAVTLSIPIRSARPASLWVVANSPLTLSRAAMDYGGITPDRKNAAWGAAVDADGVFALLMKRMGRLG